MEWVLVADDDRIDSYFPEQCAGRRVTVWDGVGRGRAEGENWVSGPTGKQDAFASGGYKPTDFDPKRYNYLVN
jgi:hypothetical protein